MRSGGDKAGMKAFSLALLAAPLLAFSAPAEAQSVCIPAAGHSAQESACNPQTDAARAWGFADSDLPVDADVRFGVLPNGMKYALHLNTTPRGGIVMRLRFDVGSLAENEDERGLAHFVEHMAFNGSTNVPEGAMIPLLERLGLAFGADTNASTGFDATTYMLDLPNNTPELIDTGLMLMRETAGNLTIAPEAVERERGVIEAERRARESFALRNFEDQIDFLFGESRLPSRMPIGTSEVIRTAPAERLRAFYERWYRPERATLVIVGDMNLDMMEAEIARRFGDWRGVGEGVPVPTAGTMTLDRPAAADVFVHPAIPEQVTISWFKPWQLERDTRALRHRRMLESIAEGAFERRLSRLALAADAPFTAAGLSEGNNFDLATGLILSASAREGEWARALTAIENEYRRAIEHGFTEAEIAEQVANARTAIRNEVAGVATRRSGGLAARLLGAADGRNVVTSPATRAALFEAFAPSITPEAVTDAFRAMRDGLGQPLVRVTAKTPVDGGEAAVLAAFANARAVAVLPPEARAAAAFAYTDFGAPGAVVSDDRIEDLGIRRIRFANNVMLNIKRTEFEDDRIRILVRVDGGALLATREDPTRVALGSILPLGGLEAHSADELRSILAGRSVGGGFGIATDSFNLSAVTTPTDLVLQTQLLAAYLTRPGFRPEAIDLLRRVLPQQYAQSDATPGAVIGRDAAFILADNDPRVAQPPLERMLALEWDGFRQAAGNSLSRGAIEIGVVGAVDEDAAIAAFAATFGALPERHAAFDPREAARDRRFANDRAPRILTHRGAADQAVVQAYWPARDDSDLDETIRLDLLAEVMGIMLTDELRERLGQTYSPSAGSSLSADFPGYGYLWTSTSVAPADIPAVEAAIDGIAARLREGALDEDLIARARTPFAERLRQSRRENSYWLGYTAIAQSDEARLDRSRRAIAELQAVTAGELTELARRYLTAEGMLRIRAVPEGWAP